MSNKIPCRQAFTDRLTELAAENKDIVVVTSDARGSVTLTKFADTYPEQFIEVGIAEQNEVGIAAGLATFGKQVFACAPACFLSARSLEQVKIDVAYSKTNVKLIGISGGVSYGALGNSHHSLHDIAVMRAFPDLSVIIPSDAEQSRQMTDALVGMKGAAYVRMGRGAVPDIYQPGQPCFTLGKSNTLTEGSDICIIACGEMVYVALQGAELLKQQGISARVIDMHTLKPLDKQSILKAADETSAILTIEEHSIMGGLGAAVAETVVQNNPVPMTIMGIPDETTVTGNSSEIFNHYGLTADGVAEQAKLLLSRCK